MIVDKFLGANGIHSVFSGKSENREKWKAKRIIYVIGISVGKMC